jgi:CheY-like chemotaxis protein
MPILIPSNLSPPACNPKYGLLPLFMYKRILLVSRDERLQETGAPVLRQGGYHTMSTTNMTSALQLAEQCQMSIIDHTFTPNEQDEFIDRVHEYNPCLFLVCLRFSLTQPQELLKVVSDCFAGQPGGSRVCVIEQNNVIAWPVRGKKIGHCF